MKVLNLFPLTILQDQISIEENERQILIDKIIKMKEENQDSNKSSYAWTGDTKGHEFLFSDHMFDNLSNKISNSIVKYLELLEINTKSLDIFINDHGQPILLRNKVLIFILILSQILVLHITF